MSKSNFSEEFKRDAVRQITDRRYPVAGVRSGYRIGARSQVLPQLELE